MAVPVYRQIKITADLYDNQLGSAQLPQIRLQVEHSTSGAFEGEQSLLVEAPTWMATDAGKRTGDGPNAWNPPLELREFAYHTEPPAGTHFYRLRWVRYREGRICAAGDWSEIVTATVATGGVTRPTTAYEPPAFKSRLGFVLSIGFSTTDGDEAIEQRTIADRRLEGSQAAHARALLARHPRAFFVWSKPFGNEVDWMDKGAGEIGRVAYAHGIERSGLKYSDTSNLRSYELKQAGIEVGGEAGEAMQRAVDRFLVDGPATITSLGAAVIVYGAPPITEHHQTTDEVIECDGGLGLMLKSNCYVGWDSSMGSDDDDPNRGQLTAIGRAASYMERHHPGVAYFLEAGLSRQEDEEWLEKYPGAATITQFNNYFNDRIWTESGGTRLELRPRRVDPEKYQDRPHIIWVSRATVGWIDQAPDQAERARRMTATAYAVLRRSKALRVVIGSDVFVDRNLSDDQMNALIAAAQ